MKRHNPETHVQRRILAAVGCEPRVVLVRNTVGEIHYYDSHGREQHLTYGLGPGSADLVGVVDGRFCGLEIKLPGETPTPSQVRWAGVVRQAGAFCCVVHSEQEAFAALARCRDGEPQ